MMELTYLIKRICDKHLKSFVEFLDSTTLDMVMILILKVWEVWAALLWVQVIMLIKRF